MINDSYIKESIKKVIHSIRLPYLYSRDFIRFWRYSSFSPFDNRKSNLEARIIFHVHAIEKGLSRNESIRYGFGKRALSKLNDSMVNYLKLDYPQNSFSFIQGLSIIKEYIEFHEEKGYDISSLLGEVITPELLTKANELTESNLIQDNDSGIMIIRKDEKKDNKNLNFVELSANRMSVREFSNEPIDVDKVVEAVKISMKTPSVCNRQGWKVYLIEDKKTIRETLVNQKGLENYPRDPECLLVITVSLSTFFSPLDRNEAFVDGGLFGMSLMYALEYVGLACVPLNAMLNSFSDRKIRKLVKIDKEDAIIMFLAVGEFMEQTIVAKSARKDANDIIYRR